MVAPVGLTSKITNMFNSGVSAAGGVAQGVNTVSSTAQLQGAILKGTGGSAAVDAQERSSREQDANQAKLIDMQSKETIKKQTMDVLNAIQSGKDDSSNKKISATAQTTKGISY
ncbi:HrpA pilus formation protein [Pseudomonas asturiensis]|uniref:HrpA pilus formation protein n=3 Tax=Pseudomonas TaxID=286 RepID=A0A1M7LLZ8_9PSED|nr:MULTISPECIES: membrane protein [Pseudomonas]MBC3954611.1 hypothetical protein [Pseudomonas triticifolii]QHF02088.1 hypothetical protein N015_06560 [Pseudomonas asturiensis]SHM79141.1 HrpA pilus formation protein [Pseudomonas asturiensis]